MDSVSAFVLISVIAAVTMATRLVGTELMRLMPVTTRVGVFLEAMSTSVLVAILATAIAAGGLRESMAALVAAVLMRVFGNATFAMLTGMASAAMWTLIAQ